MAGKARDERIGLARAAEESHVDAIYVMLVDQHGNAAARFQHAYELEGRVHGRGHQGPHAAFANLNDGIAHCADIGPAVKHGRVQIKSAGDERGQLPVCQMRSEH